MDEQPGLTKVRRHRRVPQLARWPSRRPVGIATPGRFLGLLLTSDCSLPAANPITADPSRAGCCPDRALCSGPLMPDTLYFLLSDGTTYKIEVDAGTGAQHRDAFTGGQKPYNQ